MSKEVLIIGAGTMGSAIAVVFALQDYKVTLVDQTAEKAQGAKTRNHNAAVDLIKKGYFKETDLAKIEDMSFEGEASLETLVPNFSLIIESVFEDAGVKKNLYNKLVSFMSRDCIICSNTSAINIFEIAEIPYPENLLITHWFNPAYIMELVEVVRGPKTSDETVDRVKTILQGLNKKPSVINQYIPGFIVNRLGAALMREASYMVEQGYAAPEDIDAAIELTSGIRYAFEGPIRLYDVVGWNIIKAGADTMYPSLCNAAENSLANKLVEEGNTGVFSGKGMFDYSNTTAQEYFEKRTEKIIKLQSFVNSQLKD